MAILGRGRSAAAPLLLGATLLGCSLLGGGGADRFAFSHRVHVLDQGLDCVNCHDSALVEDDPGMPRPDTCLVCHDALDEEQPPGRRVAALFDEDGVFRARHASRLSDEIVFSHARHATDEESCVRCHVGIERDRAVGPHLAVSMDACGACHAASGAPEACATCHTEIDETWVPDSHARSWEMLHGSRARSGSRAAADSCSLCHSEAGCAECHRSEPPRSHDDFFRGRGHGLIARMDRGRCNACHEPDGCAACHAESRPRNHVGMWGGTTSVHCLGCHLPLGGDGCETCHLGTPSHAQAAPKPPGHHPAMNCRQCHGLIAPLPHVDNGDDCNACHL